MGANPWKRVLATCVLLFVVIGAGAALERIDVALAGAHLPGAVSGGVGDVASVGRMTDGQRSVDIVSGWAAYDGQVIVPGPAKASTLHAIYLGLDVALMFCLGLLLVMARYASLGPPNADSARSKPGLAALPDAVRRAIVGPRTGRAPPPGSAAAAQYAVVFWSIVPIALYVLADLAETTLATLAVPEHPSGKLAQLVGGLSMAKWIGLGLAITALAIGAMQNREVKGLASAGVPRLMALRGQILVALLLVGLLIGLSGDLGRQIDDVLVVAADAVVPALVTTVLMAVTCAVLYVSGLWCLAGYRSVPADGTAPAVPSVSRRAYTVAWVGSAILAVLGGAALWAGWKATAWSIWIVAIAGFLWALLSLPAAVRRGFPLRSSSLLPVPDGARQFAAALAALPAAALYVATVRAATSQWTSGVLPKSMLWWVGLCLALGLFVSWLCWVLASHDWARSVSQQVDSLPLLVPLLMLVVSGVVGWLAALEGAEAWWAYIGTPAVVVLFAALLACGVAALVLLSDATAPRGALAMVGLRRMPFLAMIALWGLLASLADQEGRYYDARTISTVAAWDAEGGITSARLETPADAIDRWLKPLRGTKPTPGAAPDTADPPAPRTVTSLVFVASAGGGIRSAYWTARAWDCAIGTACGNTVDHTSDVFFASGVSGGAVGLAQVRAHQIDTTPQPVTAAVPNPSDPADADWVDEAMSSDYLGPSVAAFLFRDLPNSALRLPLGGMDRAATLERAFEADQVLLKGDALSQHATFPILSFSAVSVEDGCRLAISTVGQSSSSGTTNCDGADVDLPGAEGPGQEPVRDGFTYLCPAEDRSSLTLSTAAFLSARFPVVAPNGALRQCGDTGEVTYALDGGVFDNSGGSAVSRMWAEVEHDVKAFNASTTTTCVVPRLLVIDSHYASGAQPPPDGRPLQSTGPAVALGNVYAERSSRALAEATRTIRDAAAKIAHRCRVAVDPESVVTQIYPEGSSGPQGPLGWTLSESSRTDLTTQVFDVCTATPRTTAAARNNCTAVPEVQSWFASPPG